MLLYEVDNLHRQVFADGRGFPETFEFPARLGYSIGRWDGDVFVIESRGFNEETPIDGMGHPRSEGMYVTVAFAAAIWPSGHRNHLGRSEILHQAVHGEDRV